MQHQQPQNHLKATSLTFSVHEQWNITRTENIKQWQQLTAREFLNFILIEVLNTFSDCVFRAINCLDLNIFKLKKHIGWCRNSCPSSLISTCFKVFAQLVSLKEHPSRPEGLHRVHCNTKATRQRCSGIYLTPISKGEVRSCTIFNLLGLTNPL